MLGHGSPFAALAHRRFRESGRGILCWQILAWCLCACTLSPAALGQEVDLRLRLTWGGGPPRIYRGSLFVDRGSLSEPRRLGLEADLPGAMQLQGQTLHFLQRSPSNFDGVDVQVRADQDSVLTLQIRIDAQRPPQTVTIAVREFLDDYAFEYQEALGNSESRLIVRRAPGDRLRVKTDREHLVLDANERFQLEFEPRHLGLNPGSGIRCQVQLLNADRQEIWRQQFDRVIDQDRHAESLPLDFEVPEKEGVYSLVVSLSQRRFADALMRRSWIMQRQVQFVVLEPRSPTAGQGSEGDWEVVDEVDLADPEWWESWRWLPQFTRLSRAWQAPVGNDQLIVKQHDGEAYLELGAGKWYAAPLPIAELGKPHLLEIEFPLGTAQTLGISLLEPKATGEVAPLFLDSGVDVAAETGATSSGTEIHRLVFWPRTQNPWLLLTNRQANLGAKFRNVRVLTRDDHLPASGPAQDERLISAYYARPWFPENFTAPEAAETNSDAPRSLNDWQTYLTGAQRLVQYLKYAGYNSAIISVYRDGSAIYPSKHLQSTPTYDNGTFFSSGQDPLPKDVVEMLFRIFNREGLKLIPAMHFATPLPELESKLRSESETDGIRLTNARGDSWLIWNKSDQGAAPYYNPIHTDVQAAVRQVTAELLDRYSGHKSFAGLSLQLGPESYLQFPDEQWGQDPRSWDHFRRDEGTRAARLTPDQATDGSDRGLWLQWRANELSQFHRVLANEVTRRRSDSKLYLLTSNTLTSVPVQQEMRPRLLRPSNFADAMLRQGLQAEHYAGHPGLALLPARRISPLFELARQAADVSLGRSQQVGEFYRASRAAGSLTVFDSPPLRLPGFDQNGPFDPKTTVTWLSPVIPPAGLQRREHLVEGLSNSDAEILIEGGRMLPLGQEQQTRELFRAFRTIRGGAYQTVVPSSPVAQDAELVVRTREHGGQTYVYVINRGRWPVHAVFDLEIAPGGQAHALDGRAVNPVNQNGEQQLWQVAFEPFDVRSFAFSEGGVRLRDWRTQPAWPVEPSLTVAFRDVDARLKQLRQRPPMRVLTNPDFELDGPSGGILGWAASSRPGVTVELDDSTAAVGERSLHLKVDTPGTVGWVRTTPFRIPATGRISVMASIRSSDSANQPPLRLAVDLLHDGKTLRYLYAPLGTDVNGRTLQPTGAPAEPLGEDWPQNPLLFHIPELPLDGPTEVVVGFDMMGPGEAWVDNVQVFDLFFNEDEQDELLRAFAPTEFKLRRKKFAECQNYLEGYWPRFLLQYVPEPAVEQVARLPNRRDANVDPPAAAEPEKPSRWERLIPQIPFRLPFSKE